MSPREADKIIKAGEKVAVQIKPGLPFGGEPFTALFVRRDRWNIYTNEGCVFDRGDLVLAGQSK